MREGYRLQKTDLEEFLKKNNLQLALFWIYTGREMADQQLISQKVKTVLDQLMKKLQ